MSVVADGDDGDGGGWMIRTELVRIDDVVVRKTIL